jgi:hypothetical protein
MAVKRESYIKGILADRKLQLFFKDSNKESFSDFLEDTKWLLKLAYLAYIYQHLNTLNTSMQGPQENILTSTDKLLAFKNKIQVRKNHLSSGNISGSTSDSGCQIIRKSFH